jgi:hypothetical protein
MKTNSVLQYIWKLPLCGIAFLAGSVIDIFICQLFDIKPPLIYLGTNANTNWLLMLLGGTLIAFPLSFISRKSQKDWLIRWIILAEVLWISGVAGIVILCLIIIKVQPIVLAILSQYTLLPYLIPILLLSGFTAAFFPAPKTTDQIYDPTNKTPSMDVTKLLLEKPKTSLTLF